MILKAGEICLVIGSLLVWGMAVYSTLFIYTPPFYSIISHSYLSLHSKYYILNLLLGIGGYYGRLKTHTLINRADYNLPILYLSQSI